jgi:hypothetical protein
MLPQGNFMSSSVGSSKYQSILLDSSLLFLFFIAILDFSAILLVIKHHSVLKYSSKIFSNLFKLIIFKTLDSFDHVWLIYSDSWFGGHLEFLRHWKTRTIKLPVHQKNRFFVGIHENLTFIKLKLSLVYFLCYLFAFLCENPSKKLK